MKAHHTGVLNTIIPFRLARLRPGLYGPVWGDGSLLVCKNFVSKVVKTREHGNIHVMSTTGAHIRIRGNTGEVTQVPAGKFVEICDEAGAIACLVYRTNRGSVRVVMPEDIQEIQRYKDIFDVNFCRETVKVAQTVNDRSSI